MLNPGNFSTRGRNRFGEDVLVVDREGKSKIHAGGNQNGNSFHFLLLTGKKFSWCPGKPETLACLFGTPFHHPLEGRTQHLIV